MAYTPQVYLSDEAEMALKNRLIIEITNHRQERSAWVNELRKQQKDYWAPASQEKATFPFHGAANLVIPLTAIVAEAVHARLMQRLFSLDHVTSCKFKEGTWSQYDRPIERFIDWQLMEQMDYRARVEPAILEAVKFGTGVLKHGYKRIVKNVSINGQIVPQVQYQGPWTESVPLVNFLMPFTSQDPQTAPWCGEEHTASEYEMLLLEKSGLFRKGTYEKINNFYGSMYATNLSSEPYRQDIERELKQVPVWPRRTGWYELYMTISYDKKDETLRKEVVVLYHLESNTILSIRDNWEDGRRPYELGNYITLEHRWAGIGVAKQNEQFQEEVTAQHRQRLDAGAIANANMIKVKKLGNVSPNEPIFPGKMWFVDEMDEIEPFSLGGTYPSASNNEQQTLYYAQQRTGINELTLGMPQVGTPGTATSDMARVQESGIKFDYNYNNIRSLLTRNLVNVVTMIAKWGPSDPRYYDLVPEGRAIEQFFQLPASLLRSGILCKFEFVGQSANKMLDRQNWQTIQQGFTAYYSNAMQVAQMMGNPQLMMAIALQSINASTKAFNQFLESFDIPNSESLTLAPLINGLLPAISGQAVGGQNQGGFAPTGIEAGVPSSPEINAGPAVAPPTSPGPVG